MIKDRREGAILLSTVDYFIFRIFFLTFLHLFAGYENYVVFLIPGEKQFEQVEEQCRHGYSIILATKKEKTCTTKIQTSYTKKLLLHCSPLHSLISKHTSFDEKFNPLLHQSQTSRFRD